MYNHAPADYDCPICLAVNGVENEKTMIKQADIFYKDDLVLGFIGSKFVEGNEGYPILVPVEHIENLYDLPETTGHRIFDLSKDLAIALKDLRQCDGVNILQNNEPAANQHAFHYHMHIIPRFEGDRYHDNVKSTRVSDPVERIPYAEALRSYLAK